MEKATLKLRMAFGFSDCLLLVARARPTATTTTGTRAATTTATAIVVASRSTGSTGTAASRRSSRTDRRRSSAVGQIEVGLVLLVKLLTVLFFGVIATLDQDGALIGSRLALVEFMTWPLLPGSG